ncbi:hypothetical protein [Algivirga pacifica]|uniref:Peptidoglycan binding-like domain-containing protein n=1 Tax=Algivirga pacifica TaxID=1162670 RepID=A0ABP9DL33_9BACT
MDITTIGLIMGGLWLLGSGKKKAVVPSSVSNATGEQTVIRLGSQGEHVKRLQAALYKIGNQEVKNILIKTSRKPDGSWDGKVGTGTLSALRRLQFPEVLSSSQLKVILEYASKG